MVEKRRSRGGGEEGSDYSNRSKRPNSFIRDVSRISQQELGRTLEPYLRNVVREEINRVFCSYLIRDSHNQIDVGVGSRSLQLHFEGRLPNTLFTGCKVETEDRATIKVVLRDAMTRKLIRSGPHSTAKVTLRVLDGDFNKDDRDDWPPQEFHNRTVQQREGKRPLVTGTLVLALKEGIGYVEDVSFTDNSSWTRSGKFRLGATTSDPNMIREGVTNVFKVKDHRGESYKKHDRPSSGDEVWRLKKIAKDGASHNRLTDSGIFDVKGFLRLYVTDPATLRHILGKKTSDKTWNTIIRHATACLLDENDLYQFNAPDGTVLVLNSIYEVDGVIFDGDHYLSLNMLSMSQKLLVDKWKKVVYKNLNFVVPIEEHSLLLRQMLLQSLQMSSSYSNPIIIPMAPQNVNFPVERGN
ncbi:OLC1v1001983C1 [Oldenlandia corymbosa var. corymbosa]|uniref:OLC1v1001983C1 n=1 Tax=Oldenlandia corymbosa var. corymbosa TaxID=529605 RepID=A0AAV1D6P3_OLDCO|nr:OLC1v1001983C1 [Oldenlandia corymbosa var. corymbosa]